MAREEIVVVAVPVTPGTSRHSSWAKWIRKIHEPDPLTRSECGEPSFSKPFIVLPHYQISKFANILPFDLKK
jgi:hypothetical protein|tara:strand:+ start:461 stop:676 length:216 start_codon:yes stop_codon:yes gene_type:complete